MFLLGHVFVICLSSQVQIRREDLDTQNMFIMDTRQFSTYEIKQSNLSHVASGFQCSSPKMVGTAGESYVSTLLECEFLEPTIAPTTSSPTYSQPTTFPIIPPTQAPTVSLNILFLDTNSNECPEQNLLSFEECKSIPLYRGSNYVFISNNNFNHFFLI